MNLIVQKSIHQWVSEFVTQYQFSIYYNLQNIRNLTSHYFSDCSLDQGTFKKVKWQLGSKCSSSYSTLKISTASRIRTPTGDPKLKVSATALNHGKPLSSPLFLHQSQPDLCSDFQREISLLLFTAPNSTIDHPETSSAIVGLPTSYHWKARVYLC